jgi:hypothetical protein
MAIFRKLVVLVMCAGILLPVLSSADDIALLSPVLRGFPPSDNVTRLDNPSSGDNAADVAFWALFDFLQCPSLFHFAPHLGFTGTVAQPEREALSLSAPRPAGRSPPSHA